MIWHMRTFTVLFVVVGALALAACGSDDEESFAFTSADDATFSQGRSAGSIAKEAAVAPQPRPPIAPGLPAAMATPAPKALAQFRAPAAVSGGRAGEQVAKLATQQRIIIYTVDMTLEVADVVASVDTVSALAREMGGWVVSTNRAQKHRGFIAIRVPVDRLDEVVGRLRSIAADVKAENSSSRDVTDEYVDLTARLSNLEATETVLRRLFDRAETVEEALKVQQSLTDVQGEIESLKGRINLIEQTSAFSLVNVTLELEPQDMDVDAGGEQVAGVGQPVRFRAFFKPPEGLEHFTFTWDFGDGSPTVFSDRTAQTADEGTRVTAPVTHFYGDEEDSPFFAEVTITGTGDSGVAEGKASVLVTVSEIPVIEVFAGESIVVEEDEEANLIGSFTRPEGVTGLKFSWTFGDGSTRVTGDVEAGVTNAVATHKYADHRPVPYTATLTVTGTTDAGEVEASGSVSIRVTEKEGYVIGGWSVGDTGRTAVRTLSAVGAGAATGAIWLVIFSPVWIAVLAIGFFAWRRIKS